ncbi:four-carbon acid sugar kinase family protein [Nonomuraea zeae]|nr:four-carbon acid sugar kinase family protein [Nonomuraea zeae]
MTGGHVFAVADDLSGAAEVAAVLMSATRPARIALAGPPYASGPVVVVDLDGRHRTGEQAGDSVREALRHAGDRQLFLKVDSLLRGHIAATAAAALRLPSVAGPPFAVFAPSLPAAGRTVAGGVPFVHGVPLRETRAWHAEPRAAPASVIEALGGLPSVLVPLSTVRAGHATLAAALTAAAGRVAVCDAETDADLDAVVAAALGGAGARLIGAGALAAALGRALDPTPPARTGNAVIPEAGVPERRIPECRIPECRVPECRVPECRVPECRVPECRIPEVGVPEAGAPPPGTPLPAAAPSPVAVPLLVVVGTAEPGAAGQVRLLVEHGARAVQLTARDFALPSGRRTAARRVRDTLRAGPPPATVLTIEWREPEPPPPTLTRALGEIVRAALEGGPADLVLTGGETARRVLDALGVRELAPVTQVHHGAVHSRTPEGRSVITRPGSFGDRDSLLRMAAHLRPHLFATPASESHERMK